MRSQYLRLPMLLVAVSSLASAQVTTSLHRVSRSFSGEVPLVWSIQGAGTLTKASVRFLDDRGQERLAPESYAIRHLTDGNWQVWFIVSPTQTFSAFEPGQYIAEWRLEWEGGRQERTEVNFRIEDKGEGWITRAFVQADPGPFQWLVPSLWQPGTILQVGLKGTTQPRKVRYQVVDEVSENVLRPWTLLPLDQGGQWRIPFEPKWASGPIQVWTWVEDPAGAAWVESHPVILGKTAWAGASSRRTPPKSKTQTLTRTSGTKLLSQMPLAAVTSTDWLTQLNEPAPPAWQNTNRVATVSVGYVDEERTGVNLWPTDAGRPMSLAITGADGLAKPIYSVSYLLADRALSSTALDTYASTAAQVGNTSFPPGASQLQVGNVAAPVVISGGKILDLLGKPLAAGYGFVARANGAIQTAAAWTAQTPVAPMVGLSAITEGKAFKAALLATIQSATSYSGTEAIALDDSRDGYAVSLASQDPLGRTVLSKAIGSSVRPGVITTISETATNYSTDFSSGIPAWVKCSYSADLDPANGNLILPPASLVTYHVSGSTKYGSDASTDIEDSQGGSVTVALGRVTPGVTGSVSYTATGPLTVAWLVDGVQQVLPGGTVSPLSLPTLTTSGQVSIQFSNQHNVGSATPVDADYVHLDNLVITVTPPAESIEADANQLQQSVVAGFTRSQYGSVDIAGVGLCTVTMVTDPDGSAVAEVKDPEGRSVYKVVNPDSTYTSLFYDYQGYAFWPSAPKTRGLNGGTAAGANQKNLLTQYVFDVEGHLRLVVPPMGVGSALWGKTAAECSAALAWDGSSVPGSALPYATYNAYDISGHLTGTYNPDEGLTRFKVDQKGRVHFSQTASQRARTTGATWTRTLYDQIFRVRAVGEVADATAAAADMENPTIVTDGTLTDFSAAPYSLVAATSVNLYDDYLAADPTALTTPVGAAPTPLVTNPIPAAVRLLLPTGILWLAFPDGHLTRTQDANTVERYFYDQDGRIVIRWTTLKDGAGNTRDFAIGIYYDFAGRVKRLVYPAGPGGTPLQVVYTYDDLGRLFAVGTPNDVSYFARYAYQPTGEVSAIVYGPGEGFAAKRMLQDPQGWLRTLTVQGR